MKLLNKLLPIASVAGVAAIVTPLVTSCTVENPVTVNWTYQDGIYEFTTNRLDDQTNPVNNDKATELYVEAASKDKKLFAEDVIWKISNGAAALKMDEPIGLLGYMVEFTVVPLKASVTVNSIKYDETEKRGIFNFGVTFDGYADIYMVNEESGTTIEVGHMYAYGDVKYTDIPLYVSWNKYSEETPYIQSWNVAPTTHTPARGPKWLDSSLVKMNMSIPAATKTYDLRFDKDALGADLSVGYQLVESISPMYAHYLSNVEYRA